MKMLLPTTLIVALLFPFISGCSSGEKIFKKNGPAPADLILHNGSVYTMDKDLSRVDAFAVKDGKIIATGSYNELRMLQGEGTRLVDAGGRMVMPGIIDAHLHPVWGAMQQVFYCTFPFSASPGDIQKRVRDCVDNAPEETWIKGGQWTSDFFKLYEVQSPRKFLDKVSADKAVILRDDSGHNMWVNSKALALFGIDEKTPNPPGVIYEREPGSNIPNGLLLEAYKYLNELVPKGSEEKYRKAAAYAVETANSFGITGVKDASASEEEVNAIYALDKSNALSLRYAASLFITPDKMPLTEEIVEYKRLRESYRSRNINTNYVKLFLDGVPTASRTAAMIEPYAAQEGDKGAVHGPIHIEPEQLIAKLIELDKAGFEVKIHTAGDLAVRVALDAIDRVREANGDRGGWYELAHAGYVAEEDIPRFAELRVAADFSPYIWFPSPITDSVVSAVGHPRGEHYWPTRDYLDKGVRLITGSDWPSAVPDMNPWMGMETLITREDPADSSLGTFWVEQSISLEEVLWIYTQGNASALGISDVAGSIEAGKSADFIILDHNLFEIDAGAISDTQVQQTWFEGKKVYTSE